VDKRKGAWQERKPADVMLKLAESGFCPCPYGLWNISVASGKKEDTRECRGNQLPETDP